jgi:hypothetical protein
MATVVFAVWELSAGVGVTLVARWHPRVTTESTGSSGACGRGRGDFSSGSHGRGPGRADGEWTAERLGGSWGTVQRTERGLDTGPGTNLYFCKNSAHQVFVEMP